MLEELLREHLHDPRWSWAVAALGAVAEFHWAAGDQPLAVAAAGPACHAVRTVRGACLVRLDSRARLLAHERLSAHPGRWLQGLCVCLPADLARSARPGTLTELGLDRDALHAPDRQASLFDLGLGCVNLDACIRTADRALIEVLRAHAGRPLFGGDAAVVAAIKAANPTRVFRSTLARIEVYQPIAVAGAAAGTPQGPHTHVLPELLGGGRSHLAAIPVAPGMLPVLDVYPPHPGLDGDGQPRAFDAADHQRFQALLRRHGDADYLAEKARAEQALQSGVGAGDYPAPTTRRGRMALRIAVRQALAAARARGADAALLGRLDAWRARFDRQRARVVDARAH